MISERQLSSRYTSFWRQLIPMQDALARELNAQSKKYCEPLGSRVAPDRRALVNEIGFRLFRWRIESGTRGTTQVPGKVIEAVSAQASRYLQGLVAGGPMTPPTRTETQEARQIAERLGQFFGAARKRRDLHVWPRIAGCGIVSECYADVLVGKTLYEVKAGDQGVRIADVRQLLTYCALNYLSKQYTIQSIGVVNPRTGLFFSAELDQLATRLAGVGASDLSADIIYFISSDGASL